MKETDKALLTYRQGLKYEPENQELLEGERNCIRAISKWVLLLRPAVTLRVEGLHLC